MRDLCSRWRGGLGAVCLLAWLIAGCADDAGDPAGQVHLGAAGYVVSGSDGGGADYLPRSAIGLLPKDACPILPAITTFVDRAGASLLLRGERFRALGANLYYLQQ